MAEKKWLFCDSDWHEDVDHPRFASDDGTKFVLETQFGAADLDQSFPSSLDAICVIVWSILLRDSRSEVIRWIAMYAP